MSKAFKCDVCKKYEDDKANVICFISSNITAPSENIDICSECIDKINYLFSNINTTEEKSASLNLTIKTVRSI